MTKIIESAIYSLLTTNSNIDTLLKKRVYPEGEVPDKPTVPFVAYNRIATAHTNRTHSGKTYNTYRFQLDCYAKSSMDAKMLAQTIVDELDSYKGTVGSWRVDALFIEDTRDSYQSETNEFICSVELVIWAI